MRVKVAYKFCMIVAIWFSPAAAERLEISQPYDQEGRFGGQYLCVATAAGDLVKDEKTGKWRGGVFNVDDARLIANVASAEVVEVDYGTYWIRGMGYKISVGAHGESRACYQERSEDIVMSISGMVRCQAGLTEYWFHFGDMKYMSTYKSGYIDSSGDTPTHTIGECVKF